MLQAWHTGPIALVPERANRQHYEVPAAFYETILGPEMKYSSALFEDGAPNLATAEEAMMSVTAERTEIEDGMRILDLGCGWGSMSFFLAQRFPAATIVAVSNSRSQGAFIHERATRMGLSNVVHSVADVNDLELEGRFDAAVSIEMFEHVRNHPRLLERLSRYMQPGAPVLVHVFAHRRLYWAFEERGPGDWMTRHFFSGGIMPSHERFSSLVAPYAVEESWWMNGTNYQQTLERWLDRLDAERTGVERVLGDVYGPDTERWIQRWRMFLMASAEFFGYRGGHEMGVSHHRLRLG